jgi:AcrR family transcriptional regulator
MEPYPSWSKPLRKPSIPVIRRTRQLLQQALEKLLETKDFDKISVQDIADAATVNRVTFYDHYTDKFALLECVVAGRFQNLLTDATFVSTAPAPQPSRQ